MASDELLKILNAMAADEEQPADDDHRPAVCMHSDKELYDWIEERKDNTHVALSLVKRDECTGWYYDDKEGFIGMRRGPSLKSSAPNGIIQILKQVKMYVCSSL